MRCTICGVVEVAQDGEACPSCTDVDVLDAPLSTVAGIKPAALAPSLEAFSQPADAMREIEPAPNPGPTPRDGYLPRTGDLVAGQYRLQQRLGQGGMAVVYLAEDTGLQRLVAIKFILESVLDNVQAQERFLREAQMMARLEHPNTIPVYRVASHEGVPFIVTKYLEGENLSVVQRRESPLPVERTLGLMRQAAGALDSLHEQAIIHRDVKPSNLLVGRDDHLWLIDFGIARYTHTSSLTESGVLVGTALYAAPEALLGGEIDGRMDQYSLALTSYSLLTGTLPFLGRTDFERSTEKLAGVEPSSFSAMLPESARAVFAKALDPKPEQRFPTCRAFIDALAEAFAQQGIVGDVKLQQSPPSSPAPRSGRRTALGLIALISAGVIGALIFLARSPPPPRARTPLTPPEPPARISAPETENASSTDTPVASVVAISDVPTTEQGVVQWPTRSTVDAGTPSSPTNVRRRPTRLAKPTKAPDCDPPWEFDAQGDKRYKRECFP
jgi:serine/threonine protein kinase